MNQIITVSLSLEELQSLIENSVYKAIASYQPLPKKESEPEIMDVPQAMEFLHVARATLYSYVHFRKIPYIKQPGKLYFRRSELLKWMQSGRHMTEQEIKTATLNSMER